MDSNKKMINKMFKSAASLVLLAMLALLSICMLSQKGLGWFSQNKNVSADGMGVSAQVDGMEAKFFYKSEGMTDYAPLDSPDLAFSSMNPGSKIAFKVEFTNKGAASHIATVALDPGEDGEVPLHTDFNEDGADEYYYFGTQLAIFDVTSTDTSADASAYNIGAFLMPNESGTDVSADTELTPEKTNVASVTVPAASGADVGMVVLEFIIIFLNFPAVSQNAYQGFGSSDSGERCRRRMVVSYS